MASITCVLPIFAAARFYYHSSALTRVLRTATHLAEEASKASVLARRSAGCLARQLINSSCRSGDTGPRNRIDGFSGGDATWTPSSLRKSEAAATGMPPVPSSIEIVEDNVQ